MKKSQVIIVALASLGQGLSGGDRIYIEFARRWSRKLPLKIIVWEEGLRMCKQQSLTGKYLNYHLVKVGKVVNLGFLITYFYRIILGIFLGLTLKIDKPTIVMSASEFWMDSLPGMLLKIRYPQKVKWVAAWYQTAPNPFKGFAEAGRKKTYKLSAFYYFLMQLPIHPLIERFADFILVNNDSERKVFPNLKQHQRIIVVIGAVNLELVHQFLRKRNITTKHYDAVFQGRFHPQKGVIELIEIWKMVVDQRPKARLVMIGNGPLMENVKAKIKEVKLESNIKLLGYVYDGDKKFKAFSESQIVVHPAFYDSGGMAAAEAMAFGLPCIGFNLEAYKSYYPQGMAKVKKGDLKQFCDKILELLTNKTEYNRLSHAARQMVEKNWSWEKRSQEILSQLNP